MALVALVIGIIAGIFCFVLTWMISDFFIPPRFNWSKSAFSVFLLKLGMAGGAAFLGFALVSNFVLELLK